jgi:hypothetical protein
MRENPWTIKFYKLKIFLMLFFLVLIVQQNSIFSQDPTVKLINEVSVQSQRIASVGLNYGNIEGSPYYSSAFVNSKIYLKNGDFAKLLLRYDLFQDEIEFIRDEKTFWLEKKNINYIVYGRDTLIQEPLIKDPGKSTYLFAKERGKYSLCIRRKINFCPFVPARAYVTALPDRFEPVNDEYYLKKENQQAIEITNRKTLLEVLSENEPALVFIKKSKTNVNRETDLLELVRFLNNQL